MGFMWKVFYSLELKQMWMHKSAFVLHICLEYPHAQHKLSKIHLLMSHICSQRHCLKALAPWSIIITNVYVKWLSDNQKTSEFYACLQVMAAQVVVWWKRPLTPNRFFSDWLVRELHVVLAVKMMKYYIYDGAH